MYERSNMFANIECKFKYADEKTILDSIQRSGSVIINSGLGEQVTIAILVMCAHYALRGDGSLTDKQKKAIDVFLGKVANGDNEAVYKDMCREVDDSYNDLITAAGQLPPETAIAVLHYILAYVYIDGKLDDERAEFLDRTFGQALLMNFLQSGEEEVPGPFVQLSGLDADIAQYFDENDPLLTFDDVCKQFPDADRDAVKKSLDYLVEEEVLYIADTAVGKMYARLT